MVIILLGHADERDRDLRDHDSIDVAEEQ